MTVIVKVCGLRLTPPPPPPPHADTVMSKAAASASDNPSAKRRKPTCFVRRADAVASVARSNNHGPSGKLGTGAAGIPAFTVGVSESVVLEFPPEARETGFGEKLDELHIKSVVGG